MKATGTYKDGSLAKDSGYTYVSIVYNLSVSLSLYCLAMFWVATSSDLKPYRPMPKVRPLYASRLTETDVANGPQFLSVKGIIFFSFWQGFAVSIGVAAGLLRSCASHLSSSAASDYRSARLGLTSSPRSPLRHGTAVARGAGHARVLRDAALCVPPPVRLLVYRLRRRQPRLQWTTACLARHQGRVRVRLPLPFSLFVDSLCMCAHAR